jgi:hypothetical protein
MLAAVSLPSRRVVTADRPAVRALLITAAVPQMVVVVMRTSASPGPTSGTGFS